MKLPESVNILGITYTIKEVDVVNKTIPRFGELNYFKSEILLDCTMSDEKKIQTLMHEIMHGVFYALGMENLCDDERTVQSLATALCCVFGADSIAIMLNKEVKTETILWADDKLWEMEEQ